MRHAPLTTTVRLLAALVLVLTLALPAAATEPCGDFGACKALIEINSSDGDIGFHFLFDSDGMVAAQMRGPDGRPLFRDRALGDLEEQNMTETFLESSEPLCWDDPEAEPGEEVVTLEEFMERWDPGLYRIAARTADNDRVEGATPLSYLLPAAPQDVDFDGSVVSWSPGDDLGNCADFDRLAGLVAAGDLPAHPADVVVEAWEIVLVPDVDDGDPLGDLAFSIRVPGDISPLQITVPNDYLASLPADTLLKLEVGAIGVEDNATFTEGDGTCVNEDEGCEDEEDEEEEDDEEEDDEG
jgi:hypothetical protein